LNVPNLSLPSGLNVTSAYAVIAGFAKADDSTVRIMIAFYASKNAFSSGLQAVYSKDYLLPISSPESALQSLVVNGNINLLNVIYSNLQTLPDFANSTLV